MEDEFKRCVMCGRVFHVSSLNEDGVCQECLLGFPQYFDKSRCKECIKLDAKLQKYLSSLPSDYYDSKLGFVVRRKVDDPRPFMCRVHRALLDAYDSGRYISFPADFVLSKIRLRAKDCWLPQKIERLDGVVIESNPAPVTVQNYYDEYPELEGKVFRIIEKDGKYYAVFENATVEVSFGDEEPETGEFVFLRPWVLTEGYWIGLCRHKFDPEQIPYVQKYHAAPALGAAEGLVMVWCQRPHLTSNGKRCTGRVIQVAPYHILCQRCGVEVKLWEYGVDYDVG